MSEPQENSPTLSSLADEPTLDEKGLDSSAEEKEAPLDQDGSYDGYEGQDGKPLYINGAPVITGGKDVSKYLVDLRDDGDPPVTFRSIVLGTVVGGLGAALYQVCIFDIQ
jgi:hypothetical protein